MSAGKSAGENGRTPLTLRVLGTPLKVEPPVLILLAAAAGLLAWRSGAGRPDRPWTLHLLQGAGSLLALVVADFGHAIAHIPSARWAGAPMDEIYVSLNMPRTIYLDNQVPPRAHLRRALGGPIYSAAGTLVSLLLRAVMTPGTVGREVADWSLLGHGLILAGSLTPLPIVDGGSILKWTLVERGRTPAEADLIVERSSIVLGAAATAGAVGLAIGRRWLPALGLLAGGLVAIGAGLRKIR